jgi:hypothetical protein
MEWFFRDKLFTSEMIEEYQGFIYEITDISTGMKYIGKKNFWSKKTLPPLKGKKRKRRSIIESDWKKYHGSSELVKQLLIEHGEDNFKREILRLCSTKGEMSYFETKTQLVLDVLLKPDEYYNSYVGARIHRNHVKHLTKK